MDGQRSCEWCGAILLGVPACPRCDVMDEERAQRCAAWLARLGEWCGSDRAGGIACEVVRGIVRVDEPEWTAAVAWAGGVPTERDWRRALDLYGPVAAERADRGRRAYLAALERDERASRAAVR